MFTGLLMVCLVSPIVDLIDSHNCELAAPVAKFETIKQCEHYIAQETAYLETMDGQGVLALRLPVYNENRWKLRGVCTEVLVDKILTQVKS